MHERNGQEARALSVSLRGHRFSSVSPREDLCSSNMNSFSG